MVNTFKVAIAIQARKASTRLPNKSIKPLYNKTTVIDSLLDNCDFARRHIEKKNNSYNISCSVKVLVPFDETEFWNEFLRRCDVEVIDGGPLNVLSRYLRLKNYDYVVRLTSDCPNVPPMVINKAVFTAIHQNTDYLSNSWTEYRTAIDGHDVEVMSSKALHWLEDNARSDYDLEHVTPAIRNYVNDLIKGVLINKEDMSMIKTCIDTFDDYSAAVRRFASSTEKRYDAVRSGLNVYEY